MKTIILTNTKNIVLVDDENYVWLSGNFWTQSTQGYAVRYVGNPRKGTRKVILMHREIVGLRKGDRQDTDHINHNKLDNRSCNLRVCTRSQNEHNKKCMNVWKRKDTGKWTAQITNNYVVTNLGCFKTKKEAETAYVKAKIKICPYYKKRKGK